MSEIIVNESRKVALKPISSSYKGILRVANNINLLDNTTDSFLSKDYYLGPADGETTWFGNGENGTINFLSESETIKRFKSADEYINLKLPVTDSTGNYLNFALGCNSSYIGSFDELGKIEPLKEPELNVLTTKNTVYVGLEETIKPANKKKVGGNLKIDSTNDIDGKLVIKNNFHHFNGKIVSNEENEQFRTIFNCKNSFKKYDIFVYDQENYEKDKNGNRDCFINIGNLRDYAHDKANSYLETAAAPVPTGMIVSQFCSLDKWFCYDNDNGSINDYTKWQGYRPAMQNSPDAPYAYWNTIQNKALKTKAYLYYNGSTPGAYTSELPPDFKRGYILCDGSPLTIKLYPKTLQGYEDARASLDLFLDLFHIIGYYYHNDSYLDVFSNKLKYNRPKIRKAYAKSGSAGYELRDNAQSVHNFVNHNIAYTITMSTILAFMELDELFSNSYSSVDTYEKAKNALRNRKIPEKYIFNSIDPENKKLYSYLHNNGEIIQIDIGNAITKFSDTIPYYIYDETTGDYQTVHCEIVDIAEIDALIKLFLSENTVCKWSDFNYTFYTPQLYTFTDNDVNTAAAYKNGNKNKIEPVTVGQFIGSNGLTAALSINVKRGENKTIENIEEHYYSSPAIFNYSSGLDPHAHAIAKGNCKFVQWTYPGNADTSRTNVSKLNSQIYDIKNNIIGDEKDDHFIAADYRDTPDMDKAYIANYNMTNYVLQEQTPSATTINDSFTLMSGTEMSNGTNFKWYGRSSEPLWHENGSSNITKNTARYMNEYYAGYFRPESIKVLPLIKL